MDLGCQVHPVKFMIRDHAELYALERLMGTVTTG